MHSLRRSERVEFVGSEGRMLGGIVDRPDDEPRGFVIVAHCFTCTKDLKAIVRISRRLAELGWGVLRFDFAGLGNSQGDFSKTNFTTNQADLMAAAGFLESNFGPARLLIGHSFGGTAALSVAENIASVLGVACLSAPSDTQHLAALLVNRDPRIESEGQGQVTIGGRAYTIDRKMVEDFRQHDLPGMISRLTKPVLILHSPVDETVSYHNAIRIFSLITHRSDDLPPSPGASLVTLTGADHLLLNHHSDLNYVGGMINQWLTRLMA